MTPSKKIKSMLDQILTAAGWTIGIATGLISLPFLFIVLVLAVSLITLILIALSVLWATGYQKYTDWREKKKNHQRIKTAIKEEAEKIKLLADYLIRAKDPLKLAELKTQSQSDYEKESIRLLRLGEQVRKSEYFLLQLYQKERTYV
jgi:hypothetical protein